MPATPVNVSVELLEVILLLAGTILLWRQGLSRAARNTPAALPPWSVSLSDFLLFTFITFTGGLFTAFVSGLVLVRFSLPADTKTILNSAAFQLGLLAGPALLPLNLSHHPLLPTLNWRVLKSGVATFLIALPIVTVVSIAWQALLEWLHVPAEPQDLLRMFSQATEPAIIAVMVILATVIAPMTEELLFRATIFRYLRTRSPRWLAFLLSGIVFAALHLSVASFLPLVVLAIVFSFAFERTGKIGTTMIAHGLFNLHTIVLLLLGVTS